MDISVGDCRCRRPATEHGFIICNIRINMRQHFVLRVYQSNRDFSPYCMRVGMYAIKPTLQSE